MMHVVSNLSGGYSIVGLTKPNRIARQEHNGGKIPVIGAKARRFLKIGLDVRMRGRYAKEAERRRRFMR